MNIQKKIYIQSHYSDSRLLGRSNLFQCFLSLDWQITFLNKVLLTKSLFEIFSLHWNLYTTFLTISWKDLIFLLTNIPEALQGLP